MIETDLRWKPQDVVLLSKLRGAGRSITAIAAALGKSRAAVSGKICRLALPLPQVLSKNCQAEPAQMASILPAAAEQPPIPFLQVGPQHCRAILDERDERNGLLFCGELKRPGSSYCAPHHDLFHRTLTLNPRED